MNIEANLIIAVAAGLGAVFGGGGLLAWKARKHKTEAEASLTKAEAELKLLDVVARKKEVLKDTIKEPAVDQITQGFSELVRQLNARIERLETEISSMRGVMEAAIKDNEHFRMFYHDVTNSMAYCIDKENCALFKIIEKYKAQMSHEDS